MTTELEAIEALALGDDEKFFRILGGANNGRCFDFTKVGRELDYRLAHCCHKFLWNVEPQIIIRPALLYEGIEAMIIGLEKSRNTRALEWNKGDWDTDLELRSPSGRSWR